MKHRLASGSVPIHSLYMNIHLMRYKPNRIKLQGMNATPHAGDLETERETGGCWGGGGIAEQLHEQHSRQQAEQIGSRAAVAASEQQEREAKTEQ